MINLRRIVSIILDSETERRDVCIGFTMTFFYFYFLFMYTPIIDINSYI